MAPRYLKLKPDELKRRIKTAWQLAQQCRLCPHQCGVDRCNDEIGLCGIGAQAQVASYGAHPGEERPLSGTFGSGTIFFSGCNLHCIYCQNFDISQQPSGPTVSSQELANMMLDLQRRGCHNINFVSPTHVVPQILEALFAAIKGGLSLPLVYNTGGYDALPALRLLEGIFDLYLPDMKYQNGALAKSLSNAQDYPAINRRALREMHRQVGDLEVDEEGIAIKGLLIRHLVLPNDLADTPNAMAFVAERLSPNTAVNVMGQYRPEYRAHEAPKINRPVTRDEVRAAIEAAREAGLHRLNL